MDTSETVFLLSEEDEHNACAHPIENLIEMSIDVLTLETIIHELNELIVHSILKEFGEVKAEYGDITLNKFVTEPLVHVICPHGYKSLIYPMRFKGSVEDEVFVLLGEPSLLE